MNCPRFKNLMFEYLEGSLAASSRHTAEAHLSVCPACWEAVRQHRHLAHALSLGFHQAIEPLALRPDMQNRLLAALQEKRGPIAGQASLVNWWRRIVWPVAVSMALLLATALMNGFPFLSRISVIPVVRMANSEVQTVSIRLSYCVPSYSFRQEGDMVVDSVACDPRFVDETLWLSRK